MNVLWPEEVVTVRIYAVPPVSVTEALHFQQKLDETTKLLRDLQEVQNERLSAKQPPNMICLLAPTPKELELGKSPPLFLRSSLSTSYNTNNPPFISLSYKVLVCLLASDRNLLEGALTRIITELIQRY